MHDLLSSRRWTNIEPTVGTLRRPDEQNNVEQISFVNVGPTRLPTKSQRWSNADICVWFFLANLRRLTGMNSFFNEHGYSACQCDYIYFSKIFIEKDNHVNMHMTWFYINCTKNYVNVRENCFKQEKIEHVNIHRLLLRLNWTTNRHFWIIIHRLRFEINKF